MIENFEAISYQIGFHHNLINQYVVASSVLTYSSEDWSTNNIKRD
jgi:hypothetical protein